MKVLLILLFPFLLFQPDNSIKNFCLEINSYRKLDDVHLFTIYKSACYSGDNSILRLESEIENVIKYEVEETWSTRFVKELMERTMQKQSNKLSFKSEINLLGWYSASLNSSGLRMETVPFLEECILRAIAFDCEIDTYPWNRKGDMILESLEITKETADVVEYLLKISRSDYRNVNFSAEIVFSKKHNSIISISGEYNHFIIQGMYIPDMDVYSTFQLTADSEGN